MAGAARNMARQSLESCHLWIGQDRLAAAMMETSCCAETAGAAAAAAPTGATGCSSAAYCDPGCWVECCSRTAAGLFAGLSRRVRPARFLPDAAAAVAAATAFGRRGECCHAVEVPCCRQQTTLPAAIVVDVGGMTDGAVG